MNPSGQQFSSGVLEDGLENGLPGALCAKWTGTFTKLCPADPPSPNLGRDLFPSAEVFGDWLRVVR
jgi:hypothetical protein